MIMLDNTRCSLRQQPVLRGLELGSMLVNYVLRFARRHRKFGVLVVGDAPRCVGWVYYLRISIISRRRTCLCSNV